MKKFLLPALLLVFVFAACEKQSTTEPVQPNNPGILQKSDGVGDPTVQDDRFDFRKRLIVDEAALLYYRCILAANPELPERVKLALMAAIRESMAHRARIVGAMTRENHEIVLALLQAEHERLIARMNSFLTREQIIRAHILMKRRIDNP